MKMTDPVNGIDLTSSLWETLKAWGAWIPGIYAVFRVEQKASQSHRLLFDTHGQPRVMTVMSCDKCRIQCKADEQNRDANLQRELQNIHNAIAALTAAVMKK